MRSVTEHVTLSDGEMYDLPHHSSPAYRIC